MSTFTPVALELTVSSPYPNPIYGVGPVSVDIQAPGAFHVEWAVFTTTFRKIASGSQDQPGSGTFQWDLRDKTGTPAAKGLYYLRLEVTDSTGKLKRIFKLLVF